MLGAQLDRETAVSSTNEARARVSAQLYLCAPAGAWCAQRNLHAQRASVRSGTYTAELAHPATRGAGGGGTLGRPLVLARAYAPFREHKSQPQISPEPEPQISPEPEPSL